MKRFSFLLITLMFLLFSGCYSSASLSRKPAKAPTKKQVRKQPGRNEQDNDMLFDAIFHRKAQKLDGDSKLSAKEKELLRRNDISQDPVVKELRRNEHKKRQQSSDWVFGTKDGSYF